MKRRILSLALAAVLALGMCAPALASSEDMFEKMWDLALEMKDAPCVYIDVELELEADVLSGGQVRQVEVDMNGQSFNYQDGSIGGQMYWTVEPSWGKLQHGRQQLAAAPGEGAVYVARETAGDEQRSLYDFTAPGTVDDLSQVYFMFADLGDNKVNAMQGMDDGEPYLSYVADGDGLRTLLERCWPMVLQGYGDGLDWQKITASVEIELDYFYEDYAQISIESPQLGQALLELMPGVESVQSAEMSIDIDVHATYEDRYDYEAGQNLLTQNRYPDAAAEPGSCPALKTLWECLGGVFAPEIGQTADDDGREAAKDAIRAEMENAGG